MKKLVLAIVIIVFCGGMITAQPIPPQKDKIYRHLKIVLQLNDIQAEKVKGILNASDIKMKDLHQKMETNRMKDMEEMEKIKSDQEEQISKILNDEQKNKYEEFIDKQGTPPGTEMRFEGEHRLNDMHGPGDCKEPHTAGKL